MGMIDPELIKFLSQSDSGDIISAFNRLSDDHREAVKSILMGLSPVIVPLMLERPSHKTVTHRTPDGIPVTVDARIGEKMIERLTRKFLAETPEGRVIERKLRNQPLELIAMDESLTPDYVIAVLRKARSDGVKVGTLRDPEAVKPARQPVDPNMTAEFVRLRKEGYGPSLIAKHLGVRDGRVNNAVYSAKSKGVVFPEIDPNKTFG